MLLEHSNIRTYVYALTQTISVLRRQVRSNKTSSFITVVVHNRDQPGNL